MPRRPQNRRNERWFLTAARGARSHLALPGSGCLGGGRQPSVHVRVKLRKVGRRSRCVQTSLPSRVTTIVSAPPESPQGRRCQTGGPSPSSCGIRESTGRRDWCHKRMRKRAPVDHAGIGVREAVERLGHQPGAGVDRGQDPRFRSPREPAREFPHLDETECLFRTPPGAGGCRVTTCRSRAGSTSGFHSLPS